MNPRFSRKGTTLDRDPNPKVQQFFVRLSFFAADRGAVSTVLPNEASPVSSQVFRGRLMANHPANIRTKGNVTVAVSARYAVSHL